MSRGKTIMAIAASLLGAIFLLGITAQVVRRATYKWFWLDEANEILNSCAVSYSTILIKGPPPECSPAPLYFILQKTVLTIVPLNGDGVLILYRIISLGSVFLCLALLFWSVQKYMHFILGILALTLMNNQQILHTYAAENRPYALWMLVFTGCLILFSVMAAKSTHEMKRPQKIILAVAILMLNLVSAAGIIQSAGFCLFILMFQRGFASFNLRNETFSRFILLIFILSALLGLNYALRACVGHEAGQWDLLKTGDRHLVIKVVSLLFPLYRTIPSILFNIFLLMGLILPLFLYNKRHQLDPRKKFALSLAAASGIQLLFTMMIAILVAGAHYYFIPRIFIFLIVLRACLVAGGIYLVFDWLYQSLLIRRLSPGLRTVGTILLLLIVLVGAVGSLVRSETSLQEWIRGARFDSTPKLRDFQCPDRRFQIAVVQNSLDPVDFRLNFVTKLAEELGKCNLPMQSGAPFLYYTAIPASTDEKIYDFGVEQASSSTNEELIVVGRPILEH